MDKLNEIFSKQRQLMVKYGIRANMSSFDFDHQYINNAKYQNKLRECVFYLTEELYEAMNLLKNKPWRKQNTKTDSVAFRKEIADALHFYVELCVLCGFTPDTLFKQYMNKAAVNEDRQKGDY